MPSTYGLSSRAGRLLRSALALACLLTVAALTARAQAIISNGTIQLGVNQENHLNVLAGTPSSGTGTPYVGLRYVPTGAESTVPAASARAGARPTPSRTSRATRTSPLMAAWST